MGFLEVLLGRRAGRTTQNVAGYGPRTQVQSESANPSPWFAYKDTNGGLWWLNLVTQQWTSTNPLYVANNTSPPETLQGQKKQRQHHQLVLSPARMNGGQFFSPTPQNENMGGMVPVGPVPPVLIPVVGAKKKKKGHWETVREPDGDKYWRHTGSKEIRLTDPYF